MVDLSLSQTSRQFVDIERVASDVPGMPPSGLKLFRIQSSAQIASTDERYVYNMVRMVIRKSDPLSVVVYDTQSSLTGSRYQGISISELSNHLAHYSYGIQKANIPSGFSAGPIPNGTLVVAFPLQRHEGGGAIWVIINTQAIDGVCVPFTGGGDIDGGTYEGAA
jgi:hypothetical protein